MPERLTAQQLDAIEWLAGGALSVVEVASLVGCDRTTIHRWLNDRMFAAELEKRSAERREAIRRRAEAIDQSAVEVIHRRITEHSDHSLAMRWIAARGAVALSAGTEVPVPQEDLAENFVTTIAEAVRDELGEEAAARVASRLVEANRSEPE